MKRLWMIVFLSLTAYAVFAQEDYELSEPDSIIDLRGISPMNSIWNVYYRNTTQHAYIIEISNYGNIMIRNRNVKYYEKDPNYNEHAIPYTLPLFTIINREDLLDFAGRCFAPYLKKEDVEKLGTNLDITFTSDLQGKILEVYFAYPDRIQLPLETIEQLETYILTKCSLRFKPNDMLKEAKFVFFNCSLSFKAIYQAIHGLPSGVETSTPDGYKKIDSLFTKHTAMKRCVVLIHENIQKMLFWECLL